MSFLFRKGKRGSKKSRNRSLPIGMIDEKDGKPNRGKEDHSRAKSHSYGVERERPPSAKQANKSLVTKINDEPATPIPDVIASHEASRSDTASKSHSTMNNAAQVATERESGGIELKTQSTDVRNKLSISQIDGVIAKVEERNEFAETKSSHSSAVPDPFENVEEVNVHVHRPFNEDPMENVSTSSLPTDDADTEFKLDSIALNNVNRKKRSSSITHSEKEAVGTLDDVLRVFDDVDDNLQGVSANDVKTGDGRPDISEIDTTYETMADIKDDLASQDRKKQDNKRDKNTPDKTLTSTADQQNNFKSVELPIYTEPVYAKPVKSVKDTSPSQSVAPRAIQEEVQDNPPPVPAKRFVDQEHDHEIKFSPLKKTSPSSALSKSLNKTSWANASESTSPKRKPMQNSNDNFSLKRGQLSGPAPVSTDDSYVEPPRDYDINATLSSVGKSTTDESISRDTWGSMTSSSTSGSRKQNKEFRPEAAKLIDKAKARRKEKREERHHDGLVNRSFRLIREASLKETPKSATKEDATNRSDIEEDFVTIKNNADLWLEGYERMRASSEGKKSNSGTATNSYNKQNNNVSNNTRNNRHSISTTKGGNSLPLDTGLPLTETTQAVLNQTGGSGDVQVTNATSEIVARSEWKEAEKVKTSKTKVKEQKQLPRNDEIDSSDDENLINLMETGSRKDDLKNSAVVEPKRLGYVPRALRMSFGQSWDGIRKDRREWKSREMKQVTGHASRKGGKATLSNRLDEQEVQLEMLF
ncbi:rho GTPase-activating protein gacF-like [Dendronephthya gigantea]|uniref:rho GTPase-activating protein gacF-like n=1 Tax=Dendronephthya gigantea TaxID=151771 RepID=UPI00106DC319|nr:rho GTPase-activating protein gacF-like [Dendronephthya gigantea]